MIRRLRIVLLLYAGTAVFLLYAVGRMLGVAPDMGPAYPALILFGVIVWAGSGLLIFAFSIYNEVGAIRDLGYLERTQRNGDARVVALWLIKKHIWLLLIGVAEGLLMVLVLTGPAGGGNPTQRGVLVTLGLDAVNVLVALVAIGSTVSKRSLTAALDIAATAREHNQHEHPTAIGETDG